MAKQTYITLVFLSTHKSISRPAGRISSRHSDQFRALKELNKKK